MNKKEFRELLKSWVDDLGRVNSWFIRRYGGQNSSQCYKEMYQMVQTMWYDHRDIFPNKGIYKMVRRLFIKNVALFYNKHPCLWQYLPANLCKEILHKVDQTWISFNNDIQFDFRIYLIWKADKVGYTKRRSKHICYVNDGLRVVFDKEEAIGIVNLLPRSNYPVEILFFKPLTTGDISRSSAKKTIESWNHAHYPKYYAYFPTFATCRMANDFLMDESTESEPIVHNCYVDVIKPRATHYGAINFALDDEAEIESAENNKVVKKLYASLYMTLEDFVKINPYAAFPNIYITNWHRAEW